MARPVVELASESATGARAPSLRIIDAGTVNAVRSQSLWHGIASAMTEDAAPTLSFCRSAEPYVCIGFHRSLDELDLAACGDLGLPIIRRQIGGGPVYIDQDQLFFQLTLPAAQAPVRVDRLYQRFLGPAVTAFRALGLEASLSGLNDIVVGDRKISGTGAGRIRNGVTVVGNVIFRFPHRSMARVLALPNAVRDEYRALMQRYVSSLAAEGLENVGDDEAKQSLIQAYAGAFEAQPDDDRLTALEESEIAEWDARLTDGKWLAGRAKPETLPTQESFHRVKINTAVWLIAAQAEELEVQATIIEETFDKLVIHNPTFNGEAAAMARALSGTPANGVDLRRRLQPFGVHGQRLADLLEPGLTLH
jgi:lipoate-protein ligase A